MVENEEFGGINRFDRKLEGARRELGGSNGGRSE